jgi:hypothetical protein
MQGLLENELVEKWCFYLTGYFISGIGTLPFSPASFSTMLEF